jgi:hypothetical protein
MGNSAQTKSIKRKPNLPDIEFRIIKGKNEPIFKNVEDTCNFLKYLQLHEYLELLFSYQITTVDSSSHLGIMRETNFPMFLEMKILKNILVFAESGRNDVNYTLFKDFYTNFFSFLHKTYKSYYKSVYDEKLHQEETSVPKLTLVPLGLFHCGGSNKAKIELIFNLCCNDNYEVEANSEVLRMLFFFILIIPSGVTLLTLNAVAKENDSVRDMFPEDEFIRIYDAYQVKDSLRELDKVLGILFKGEERLSFEAFQKSILTNNLEWIFSSAGVRNYLETHND